MVKQIKENKLLMSLALTTKMTLAIVKLLTHRIEMLEKEALKRDRLIEKLDRAITTLKDG